MGNSSLRSNEHLLIFRTRRSDYEGSEDKREVFALCTRVGSVYCLLSFAFKFLRHFGSESLHEIDRSCPYECGYDISEALQLIVLI